MKYGDTIFDGIGESMPIRPDEIGIDMLSPLFISMTGDGAFDVASSPNKAPKTTDQLLRSLSVYGPHRFRYPEIQKYFWKDDMEELIIEII